MKANCPTGKTSRPGLNLQLNYERKDIYEAGFMLLAGHLCFNTIFFFFFFFLIKQQLLFVLSTSQFDRSCWWL
jgi:hypothetical protein